MLTPSLTDKCWEEYRVVSGLWMSLEIPMVAGATPVPLVGTPRRYDTFVFGFPGSRFLDKVQTAVF